MQSRVACVSVCRGCEVHTIPPQLGSESLPLSSFSKALVACPLAAAMRRPAAKAKAKAKAPRLDIGQLGSWKPGTGPDMRPIYTRWPVSQSSYTPELLQKYAARAEELSLSTATRGRQDRLRRMRRNYLCICGDDCRLSDIQHSAMVISS